MTTPYRVNVKKSRGKMCVQLISATSKGVKYVKAEEEIDAAASSAPGFKNKLGAAVTKLLAEPPTVPQ